MTNEARTPVAVGPELVEIVSVALASGLPFSLEGPHGIGKSEIITQAAASLGLQSVVIDLSVVEPPDLLGLPIFVDGKTRYAPPAIWPTEGRGLVVLEELNRAPPFALVPLLQLLTTRSIGDVRLPDGWGFAASMNSEQDADYRVHPLDPALSSRFVRISVEPHAPSWLAWAAGAGVHPRVAEFVRVTPGIFTSKVSNPRAWAYASRLLFAWEKSGKPMPHLHALLAGVLDDTWASAFGGWLARSEAPLEAKRILEEYGAVRALVIDWRKKRRTDLLAGSFQRLRAYLQRQAHYDALLEDAPALARVRDFIGDLPGDIRRQAREWLLERGYSALVPGDKEAAHGIR